MTETMQPSKFKYIDGIVIAKNKEPIERLTFLEIAYQLRRIADLMIM